VVVVRGTKRRRPISKGTLDIGIVKVRTSK